MTVGLLYPWILAVDSMAAWWGLAARAIDPSGPESNIVVRQDFAPRASSRSKTAVSAKSAELISLASYRKSVR